MAFTPTEYTFLASGQLITSIIDPFVVSSMLMLSFIFVIVCYLFE